ncbi:hypothetical protein RJ640_020172 [Escallonia rubra]|uniref:Kinesin motor domain-containing protein n=1 Tax=Escallonia rubra TaxID=112253 RepID=A0AA88RCE1_9ASTE|nr:hypothetical protein RJ640_020172 [Escallonia rubra]
MAHNRWNWEVAGFEPKKAVDDHKPPPPVAHRRYSISASSISPRSDSSRQALAPKLQKLKDKVKVEALIVYRSRQLLVDRCNIYFALWDRMVSWLAREDYLELRQEASDLQEYSNAKLDRVTRYLGVLAQKTHQAALETEARISPLINEKKRLYNELLTAKGNIKVFCRTRPLFEDEGPSVVEFPDDFTIRVNTGDDNVSNGKKDFEFDRVYGPHVGQGGRVMVYFSCFE